jgi:tripartite-type tricarboxylate transporter receptor subunit TctC
VLALTMVVALVLVAVGCSGGGMEATGQGGAGGGEERSGGRVTEVAGSTIEDELGHQAFQPSTRLVVPADEDDALDRAARVLAGLSEGPLGARVFVDQRPGDGGELAWRDVANEEADGHQLAYVTEGLLASGRSGDGGIGPGDFEMVAQTDSGSAVLVAKGDPEVETLQWEDFEELGDLIRAAEEDPGLVEVADPGAGTVFRAGTLALEREAGIDLAEKSPVNKSPVQAVHDSDVEAALVPLDAGVLADVWAGELLPIAVFGEEPAAGLPRVPTARELGYDVSVPVFGGIAAPSGTPPKVVDELGRVFVGASSSRVFGKVLVGTGREPMQRGPEEFTRYLAEQSRLLSRATSETEEGG